MHFPPNCLLNHLNLRCMQTCSIEELAWMTYKTNKQGKNFNRNSFQKREFFKKTGILVFNVTNLHYPHTPKNPKECPHLANYKQKLVKQIVATWDDYSVACFHDWAHSQTVLKLSTLVANYRN